MSMSPRLLRPRQTIHPEAASWAARVVANGGTVSGTTLSAVDKFCKAIASAGIRDRFFRLNLFAGNSDASLNAVRTPLFRGPSLGGTQYGNTTDDNNNFLAGDYAETAGLKSNGSTQYLNTGYPANTLAASNTHLAIGLLATETRANADRTAIGAVNTGSGTFFSIDLRRPNSSLGVGQRLCSLGSYTATAYFGDTGHAASMAIGNLVANADKQYRNGSETGTTSSLLTNYGAAHSIYLFGANNGAAGGTAMNFTDARIGSYSIGAVMTAGQVAAYNSALAAFNSSLART